MDDINGIEDFSGTGSYQYNPRAKRKSFSELAAAAQGKLPGRSTAAVASSAPAAPANPVIAAPVAPAPQQEGMMGYGKILNAMNSPEAWEAAMEAGSARSDLAAQRMMQMGEPRNIPYGGKMSWLEALNNGVKQGLGMYDYLGSQKAKASALRKYRDIFDKMSPAGGMGTLKNVTKGELADLEARGRANADEFWAGRE